MDRGVERSGKVEVICLEGGGIQDVYDSDQAR